MQTNAYAFDTSYDVEQPTRRTVTAVVIDLPNHEFQSTKSASGLVVALFYGHYQLPLHVALKFAPHHLVEGMSV